MFKRIVLMVVTLCLMTFSLVAQAAPRVAVLYANNAKTTYDAVLDDCILQNLEKALSSRGYEFVKNDAALESLKSMGMNDLSMAERRDIIEAVNSIDFNYIICVTVEPMIRKEKFSLLTQGIEMTATVPFKMIDAKADRYLYNGKFLEKQGSSTPIGSVGNKSVALKALNKVNESINKVVAEKLTVVK